MVRNNFVGLLISNNLLSLLTNASFLRYSSTEEVIVGEDALRLHPNSNYNIHFPYKRGDINVHDGIGTLNGATVSQSVPKLLNCSIAGGSQSAILADLVTIWSYAIKELLKIPLDTLSEYKAVLIIPAMYQRSLIKHLVSLLLIDIGFGGCFVVQDHVAATFGAGLGNKDHLNACPMCFLKSYNCYSLFQFKGYACVVDIGAEKTSISCVEDGVSQPETRIHLDYGGSDVTQVRKQRSNALCELS